MCTASNGRVVCDPAPCGQSERRAVKSIEEDKWWIRWEPGGSVTRKATVIWVSGRKNYEF